MKKTILNLLIIFCLCLFLAKPLSAQEATDSAVSDEVKQKIKQKLEEVVDKTLENVKGVIKENVSQKIYGYTGNVIDINDSVLTLKSGVVEKKVEIASEAAILKVITGEGRSSIKADEIEENDFVLAMGNMKEENLLLGRRLIISEQPAPAPLRKVLSGKVQEIDGSRLTFSTDEDEQQIEVGKNTVLKVNGLEDPDVEDIIIGDLIYVIAQYDEDNKLDRIKSVLVMPGKANPAAEENEMEETTPSAETSEEPEKE
jgi:hypothetical protein